MELEDFPQTKQGGVDYVMEIFRNMGGRILPPQRPRQNYEIMTPANDAFMMDFEISCLEQNWDSSKRQHPQGPNRHENPEWAAMIQRQVFPHHSDLDWAEYCSWVRCGGGDEIFQEEDEERRLEFLLERDEQQFLPGYLEAQTRLRTSYACRDMVRPLSAPLDERIVTMAHIVNGQRSASTNL